MNADYTTCEIENRTSPTTPSIKVDGGALTIDAVAAIARNRTKVHLADDRATNDRIHRSMEYIQNAVAKSEPIYGVTTGFGGMANVVIPKEHAEDLQNNLPIAHKSGAGKLLPTADVRAAMAIRLNSLMRGVSGIRPELIQRIALFLNENVCPEMRDLGSIGASGDLVPLAYLAGAISGCDPAFRVNFDGESVDCQTALRRLQLKPLRLAPKEGLAIMNGTSVMAGIASNCLSDARLLTGVALGAHGLLIQAAGATNQSFHPFIHQHKPHPGQIWSAETVLRMITGSRLIRNELDGKHEHRGASPIQDRYALRCLPQYLGPIIDGLRTLQRQLEIEINSATDNPLIDAEAGTSYHCGNFLGQYVGVGMDQLRYYLGLIAKHLDVQIAFVVAPEFSNGLPASLVGNPGRKVNMGLKALQITGNSIMPLLCYLGTPLVDRFPTHAEQFNQNINSQGFGSANLARQSIELMRQYTAISLIFGAQAVALRSRVVTGRCNWKEMLSTSSRVLVEAVYNVLELECRDDRPLIWNDQEQEMDSYIARIADDLRAHGRIAHAVKWVCAGLSEPAVGASPAAAHHN